MDSEAMDLFEDEKEEGDLEGQQQAKTSNEVLV
jgi:hypothetical protein